jgi:hypothetical protein
MYDLPGGPALLALAGDVLLDELLPLLPEERRLDALLVANCMAIAEREAEGVPEGLILRELQKFYDRAPHPGPPPHCGGGRDPRSGRVGAMPDLLRRFAHDLRIGAFENSQRCDRDARGILWRLTLVKLGLANPKFLAANGFSSWAALSRE